MFFDPISSWLVALIADGIVIAGDKADLGNLAQYRKENIKWANESLNECIRKIKKDYGLILAENAYEQIQLQLSTARESYSFYGKQDQIIIDLDNQEYIIDVLEACSIVYSQYSYEEAQQKAKWFKNATIEAKRKKKQYEIKLEKTRIEEKKHREEDKKRTTIWIAAAIVIIAVAAIIGSAS